jgi:alpha-beta hydrolase superfamily lysophospholipase
MRLGVLCFAAVVCALLVAAAASDREIDLTLTTSDGVRVHGTYVSQPGATGKGLILLHMLRHERSDWRAFAATTQAAGYNSLAIDLRGHGHSLHTVDGRTLNLASFTDADFAAMIHDVDAAYQYLRQRADIDQAHVYIVGASIGANLALNFAAAHPDGIKAVVLLSPGLDYHGVTTEAAAAKYSGRLLLYASHDDTYAYNSVQKLAQIAGAPRGLARYFEGGGHGTDLLTAHAEMTGAIISWLNGIP